MKNFNITATKHGTLILAKNVRAAKRIFRRHFKSEKIIYAKEAGKIKQRLF